MNGILIHEVGMRDGLQVEQQTVPTGQKIAWIERLITSGVDFIQVGSFVNPKVVPQMADTDALFAHFAREGAVPPSVRLTALVLNEKGLERGLAAGVTYFCMGVSASDTHSRRNTGMGTDEALTRILAMAAIARAAGANVQLAVQSAFGCGFEGPVPAARVLRIVDRFISSGVRVISLADTAGHAAPSQVERLFADVRAIEPDVVCACHLHDTYGMAMANASAALNAGVRYFEAAFGGLGGCPFTALAAGNLCTEDFVHMLHREGHRHDISLEALSEVAREAGRFFGRQLPGAVHRVGTIGDVVPASAAKE
jgi:hydroxymethylglutaryl-CoA lyase